MRRAKKVEATEAEEAFFDALRNTVLAHEPLGVERLTAVMAKMMGFLAAQCTRWTDQEVMEAIYLNMGEGASEVAKHLEETAGNARH